MEESTLVNEWMAKAEARGEARGKEIGGMEEARKVILRLAAKRLGPAPAEAKSALELMQDRARLERIIERVIDATSWDDLLATA